MSPSEDSRRAFLKQGALFLAGSTVAGAASSPAWAAAPEDADYQLRLGLLTDCHYADKPAGGTRHYRDSLAKLQEAVAECGRSGVKFVVELGDFIDSADDLNTEIGYLQSIEREYAKFKGDRHYVLGNHCVYTLTKQEFFDNCAAQRPPYSFDEGGFHFVVLDACFRADGVAYGRQNFDWTDAHVPTEQLEWLAADLAAAENNSILLVHQRLDTSDILAVRNAKRVRKVLENSGRVLAVFQGHSHLNDYREIRGIHYCTLRAVVEEPGLENSGYALLDLFADGSIRLKGFRQQRDYKLAT